MGRADKRNGKKAAPVAARKGNVKRKEAAVVDPLAGLDAPKLLGDIATIGERRDNLSQQSLKNHRFDLSKHVGSLLKTYPNHNFFIYKGSPQLLNDAKTLLPNIRLISVPSRKNPPNYMAYKHKHGDASVVVKDMTKEYQMKWRRVAPRVYILKSSQRKTKTSIRAMDEESMCKEEHLDLFTQKPSSDWKVNKHGKLDVRFVNFRVPDANGELIFAAFDKDDGVRLADYIEEFLEENELGIERHSDVEAAIRQAFEHAREVIEGYMELLEGDGFDRETLDNIKTMKIYPVGAPEEAKSREMGCFYGKADQVL